MPSSYVHPFSGCFSEYPYFHTDPFYRQAAAQGAAAPTNTAAATGSQTSGGSASAPSATQSGNSALDISAQKLTSALAALGLIASLTL